MEAAISPASPAIGQFWAVIIGQTMPARLRVWNQAEIVAAMTGRQ
jgi:hypothetical protein